MFIILLLLLLFCWLVVFAKIFFFLYRNYFMIVAWNRPWVANPKHKSYPLQRIQTLRPLARDSKSNKQTKAEKVWRFLRENSGLIWQVGDRFLGRLPCQCDSHFCLNKAKDIIVYAAQKCQQLEVIAGCSTDPPLQFKKNVNASKRIKRFAIYCELF